MHLTNQSVAVSADLSWDNDDEDDEDDDENGLYGECARLRLCQSF